MLKNHLLHQLFEGLVGIGMALPPAMARAVGGLLGRAALHLAARERRRAETQLLDRYVEVLGRASDPVEVRSRRVRATVRAVFANLGRWSAELCSYAARLDRVEQRIVLPPRSARVLRDALAPGRGVLFLTGHLGHWELMSWGLTLRGFPVAAVGRESYHPGITDLVGWLRTRAGADIILRDDPGGPRRLLGALARGRIVGLFVDQSTDLPSRRVQFLGRSAPTLEAPARLALRHRGAVVFGWCHESAGGTLRMEIQPVELSGHETIPQALRVINGHVERAVRARPDHWVWMHDRWNERVSRSS